MLPQLAVLRAFSSWQVRLDKLNSSAEEGDVAAVIAQTLVEPRTIHRTIRFNTGRTPVAEALQA